MYMIEYFELLLYHARDTREAKPRKAARPFSLVFSVGLQCHRRQGLVMLVGLYAAVIGRWWCYLHYGMCVCVGGVRARVC